MLNSFVFAEEKTNQQENKEDEGRVIPDIEFKDKVLIEGLKLFTNGEYEKAVFRFESYLLYRIRNLDDLFGLGVMSFGMIPNKLTEGTKYFQQKIEKSPGNLGLRYKKAIFEIMSLEIMDLSRNPNMNDYIEKIKSYQPNSLKTHYILGLIYLLQSEHELYLDECDYLENKNSKLSKRLRSIYDKSVLIKNFLEDKVKERRKRENANKEE